MITGHQISAAYLPRTLCRGPEELKMSGGDSADDRGWTQGDVSEEQDLPKSDAELGAVVYQMASV